MLAVHHVILHDAGRDRAERPEPHHQLHAGEGGAGRHDPVEHGRGEVQAGRRRRGRRGPGGVDGLVAVGVVEVDVAQVGRKGHLAVSGQRRVEVVGDRPDEASSLTEVGAHLEGEVLAHLDDDTIGELRGWPDEGLPPAVDGRLEEEDLGRSTGGSTESDPGRQHLGVVDDDDVAGADECRQVGDVAMLHVVAGVDQQSRPVTRLDTRTRDRGLRQLVVEVRGVQAQSSATFGNSSRAHVSISRTGSGVDGAMRISSTPSAA